MPYITGFERDGMVLATREISGLPFAITERKIAITS
jgi:hypothetical protein